MKVKLVFDDWRQKGHVLSVYNTSLGLELSSGDLHSGTTFSGELSVDPTIEAEIIAAQKQHGAYPVFRVISQEATPLTINPKG